MFDRRMPDLEQGVFETLLVIDGRPVELDAHTARLKASLAELFPKRVVPALGQEDVPEESGVMRIDVAPNAGRLEVGISFREIKQEPETVVLHSLEVDGGLGAHKWADRSLIDDAQASLPAGALPLITDTDGAVLEVSRANVFAVRDGALFTPPLDGRILPGITRMRVLDLASELGIDAYEGELSRADLLTADEVFLSGSVHGIEPVGSVDGTPLSGGGHVTARLATRLWQAWTAAKTAPSEGALR